MADGGEAVVVFGTEEDDLRLLFSLLGTLSISWDSWDTGDDEGVMVADDLVLADNTGVILAGESLVGPTELLMIKTSISLVY